MTNKIAIIGKIRSGKDTVASHFIKEGMKEYKFGTGIAEVIQRYFPEEWAKGKPRHLYQSIGQHFRELNPNVWIEYLARQIEGQPNIIITDVRQENEVKWLMDNGFTIIKVVAPEHIRIQRIKDSGDLGTEEELQSLLNHETEQYTNISPYHFIVQNDGSPEDLKNDINQIQQIMKGSTQA